MSIIRLIILFSFVFFFFSCSQRSEIFMVAASMNNLMTEIQSENPQFNDIPISYGGSISIVRRIENNKRGVGAVLLSSEESFDILDKLGYLDNELSYTFASNSLVLIGKTNKKIITTKDIESIKKKVVIADPKIAPAGVYSLQSLGSLNQEFLDENVIFAGDVSSVVGSVKNNINFVGIVYKTDAISHNLQVLFEFPTNSHDKILYKLGVLKNNSGNSILKYVKFLKSSFVKQKLVDHGYLVE